MNLKKNFYTDLFIIFFIFIIDRISKIYIISLAEKNYNSELFASKFINIHLIWNEGIAFGLFSFGNITVYNFFTLIIAIIILIIFYMLFKSNGLEKYSLIMILGGALGNIFDRIVSKAVPDFIDLHIANYHWFIFNVADIFITLGIIFMIFLEITDIKTKKEL